MHAQNKVFYNLKYDAVFKLVVRENKEYLKKIISNILEEEVKEIEFIENELPRENKNNKNNTLDLLIRINKNKIIDVEVNSKYDEIIRERNLIYYTTLYSINSKKKYPEEEKILIDLVYTIKGKSAKEKKERYNIISNKSKKIYSKKFKIIEVNIAVYKKRWYRGEGKEEDKYIVALDASKEELEELSKEDEILKEVKEKVFTFNEDGAIRLISIEEERELMQKARERKALEKGINKGRKEGLITGREEGLITGKKEGLITGRKEGEQKILCELLKIYDIEKVHEMTKVPIKEIEKIRK